MKRVVAGLAVTATLLGGCTGYMDFNPMGNAYDDAIAMTRGNSACDDARGPASADPASGCVVSRPGVKK
jgi:hypothetical protein